MISEQAGAALSIIKGVEMCRQTDANFWAAAVSRIVYDLDEAGDEQGVRIVADMMSDMFKKLPVKDV